VFSCLPLRGPITVTVKTLERALQCHGGQPLTVWRAGTPRVTACSPMAVQLASSGGTRPQWPGAAQPVCALFSCVCCLPPRTATL